jgi:hypothetical protein
MSQCFSGSTVKTERDFAGAVEKFKQMVADPARASHPLGLAASSIRP